MQVRWKEGGMLSSSACEFTGRDRERGSPGLRAVTSSEAKALLIPGGEKEEERKRQQQIPAG